MQYPGEEEILKFLKNRKSSSIKEVSQGCSLNLDTVRRASESLKAKGLISLEIIKKEILMDSPIRKDFEKLGEFPEDLIYKKSLKKLNVSELSTQEKSFALPWAIKKGLVKIESGKIIPVADETAARQIHLASAAITSSNPLTSAQKEEGIRRKWLIKQEETEVKLTLKESGPASNHLIFEKNNNFDVNVPVKNALLGKTHPLSRAISKMKEIFVQMGFEEMEGEYVESTFWNFDALFQPQDHPARELADTFYLEHSFQLPDNKLVNKIKNSHQKGWKYKWSFKEAQKAVLRTHTTCLSARYLSMLKDTRKKYFSVGRVFRNEATDFKHLSEFHQVEGIIAWNKATFCDLLGILKEFYSKLGFKQIRVRPSYFPYTEPSLEIEVYYAPKKQWMELGGAGIFRPEVTKPLTNVYPVLAWGLSLERPLMISLGIDDIRTFYKNDLEWLKSVRVRE
ncbi:MAG: phenylalanine--tRNA ligase subunit alpha [Candidatus Micrarchaeia archaeon]